jgi:nucleoside-diphosphate-sugar epimerase
MNVAVTGASGYVGGAIAAHFEKHGHQVLRLSRRPCPGNWLHFTLGDDSSSLSWDGIDVLVHAAYDFSLHTWDGIQSVNIDPSIALLSAARAAGVRHVIFISTLSAFDGCVSLYGKAKLAIEKETLPRGGTVIRPGLVWGDRPGGMMASLEKAVRALPVVPYLCGAGGLRQFLVHEDDLAGAVVSISSREPIAGIISFAHPAALTLREILAGISNKRKLLRLFFPVPWLIAMVFLKLAENCGIPLPFRSDSLKGLVHGNATVVFGTQDFLKVPRPFILKP